MWQYVSRRKAHLVDQGRYGKETLETKISSLVYELVRAYQEKQVP